MFPWYWAHVRPLCLLWIVIHIGRRPCPYFYFTVLNDFKKSCSRETVFHVVPFSKCTYACCRTFFVGNAWASPLLPTLHKHWFLWTEFFTYKSRISTLPRASTLWTGFCELSGGVVTLWTEKWKSHRALSRINLDCVTESTAGYNTTRVFERWSIFNPASAVRDAPAHVPLALPSPLLPTASVMPYFLRSSDPTANFFARPSASPFPFLLDFELRETFFRRPHSRVLFFGRQQYRPSLDDFNTVWPSGDLYHNLHIFCISLFLLGPYSPLQIFFVMGAYCFLFPCSILFCVY